MNISWSDQAALVVVMAANGYPGSYQKGSIIRGLDRLASHPKISVYHAGTSHDGTYFTAETGRVLGITARGATVTDAQRRAYNAVDLLDWPEGFCRRDIGWRAVAREKVQTCETVYA